MLWFRSVPAGKAVIVAVWIAQAEVRQAPRSGPQIRLELRARTDKAFPQPVDVIDLNHDFGTRWHGSQGRIDGCGFRSTDACLAQSKRRVSGRTVGATGGLDPSRS